MDLAEARQFLATHHCAILATRRRDGRLQMSPVTVGVDAAGRVIVSSRETAYKTRHLRRDPRASLCVFRDEFYGPWAQIVLGLTEPQSSGIGGGALLLLYDGTRVVAFDGRETAPAAATPDRFLDVHGRPLPFRDAVVGGRSVGVPGVLKMLDMAHKHYGRLPWATLFQPAIRLADEGFPVSRRLHLLLASDQYLRHVEPTRSYFYQADGTPKAIGTHLRNPDYAHVL